MKNKLTVIFTCYNRKEKTINALMSIVDKNPSLQFRFIIIDDKSTDGTIEAIIGLNLDVEIIIGTGKLFWCGAMRVGIERYFQQDDRMDCLLINDDVEFYERAIEKIVSQSRGKSSVVVVGATQSKAGAFTYGLRKNRNKNGIWLMHIEPNEDETCGETMNANCVLIPYEIMKNIGNMDSIYTHSLGDYDLGFYISKMGYKLISSEEYVGICEENGLENTWRDASLSRRERLRKKESPKGLPNKEWFHFLHKNYGLKKAIVYSTIPYLKILFKK